MPKSGAYAFEIIENGTPEVPRVLSVTNMSLPAGVSLSEDESSSTFDQYVGIREIAPTGTATTKAVDQALRLIGLQGVCLGDLPNTINRVAQYYEPKTSCGVDTVSQNVAFTSTSGLLRLGTLTAQRGQDATITIDGDWLSSDGNVAPVIQSNPAMLPDRDESRFTLGPPQIANLQFPEATSVTINFNVTLTTKEAAFGSAYPTEVGVTKVRPDIRIDNADIDLLKSAGVPLDGRTAVHAETTLPFRKYLNGGLFQPDGDPVHFSIAASGLFYFDTIATGGGTNNATNSLVLRCASEGALAPLTFTFDQAYAG